MIGGERKENTGTGCSCHTAGRRTGKAARRYPDKKAKKTPHSWVGKEVEVGLAVPAGHLDRDPYTLHPVGGVYKLGILEEVNEHGIVGAFSGIHDVLTERPAPRSRFYPWSAVLSIGSPEDPDVAEVRPIR